MKQLNLWAEINTSEDSMPLRAQAIIYDVFACPFCVYLEQYIDIINVKKGLTRFEQDLNHVIKCSYGILTYLLVKES